MSEIPKIDTQKTKDIIVEFIKNKVDDAKGEGVVIGLSGGIDSTLCAYLAAEALGRENVFGVIMPSTTTPTEDKLHGMDVAQKLNIQHKEIAIDSILNEIRIATQIEDKLATGNLKARIRMSILYFYANSKNYLVCGTGNKSELLIGYFTKFGDGAADIEPIGDLYKTEVKLLAKSLNISSDIIEKPPRAGLWNNQSDEAEIGMDYDLLDKILYSYSENDMSDDEIADSLNIELSDVDMIIDKIIGNEHKSKIPESPKKMVIK